MNLFSGICQRYTPAAVGFVEALVYQQPGPTPPVSHSLIWRILREQTALLYSPAGAGLCPVMN